VVLDLGSAGTPGTLAAAPGGVLFSGPANSGPLSQTIAISSDSTPFSWNAVGLAGSGGTWLAVSPASASGDGTLQVTANLAGLQQGSYNGQVLISATGTSNAVVIIPVTLIVSSGTTPVTTANTLQPIQPAGDFIANEGVPVALEALILSPTGAPITGATVQVAFTTGDAPVVLTDVGGGSYTGVWTPLHAGAASLLFTTSNSPAGVVTGVVLASAGMPAFPAAGVVNAAPMISGAPLAIGSIAAMFGLNLASQPASATSFPLPLTLGGASVTINGIPAPLFYASPLQINFFVPYELAGQTAATIVVSTPNGLAVATGVPIAPQSPGLFLTDAAGDPAVIHTNGQPVSTASPAAGGEIVEIFATGLGPVSNAPADNAAAPVSPLAMDTITPRVIIGGVDAEVKFAGLAPGFAGLNQINVVVPKGLPSGPATLTIAVGPLFGNSTVLLVR
jgi:adhesin/invasin